jgi:hypothetical protein
VYLRYVDRRDFLNFESDGTHSNHSTSECELFCGTMLNNNVSRETIIEISGPTSPLKI